MRFEINHCSFAYPGGQEVLKDLSFSFQSNEITGILGRNGAGKTTLLKCLLGLLPWNSGHCTIDGKILEQKDFRNLWKNVAYVPQAKSVVFSLSVRDMTVLGRAAQWRAFQSPGKEDWKAADRALEITGCTSFANKLCSEISGGQYQIALLARALASEPKMLILDEPESNLDFKNQLLILKLLKKLSSDMGIGSVVNTHYPSHALEISQNALILMQDGSTVFGKSRKVITEENLKNSFGVDVSIIPLEVPGRDRYCAVVAKSKFNI